MPTVSLNWSDDNAGSSQESGFKIYRSNTPLDLATLPAPIVVLAANVTTYDDTSAVAGDNYYIVSTYRAGAERYSGQKLITVGSAVAGSLYPPAVFAGASGGVVLDASIFASLFKDTAGIIPVTADGDKVALWLDQSGYGAHYSQADLALRPTYRTGGGKPYLDFPGTAYMDSALGEMNFANISYHTGLTSTAINTVPFDCPHVPGSAVSPYRRWGVWHDNQNRAIIIPNGVAATIGTSPGWQSSAIHFGFDSVAGEVYKNGSVLGTFPSVVISYPNVTHARIGASGWGSDFSTIKVYGVLAADKGFSAADVANVNAWLQSLMY